ncbi:MAG: hypothetical protein HYZ53_29800 [Planctomycetes bacterium]|nr:hypothetical protein [Planctomycetota bacterium]
MSRAPARSEPPSPPSQLDYFPRERLQELLEGLPPAEYASLAKSVEKAGSDRSVVFYPSDTQRRLIQIALRPWILTPTQREYFRQVYLHIEDACRKLYPLSLEDPEVKRLLPLSEAERDWFDRSFPHGRVPLQTLFGRLDATVDAGRPDWRDTLRVIEVNLSGIGATYYSFAAGQIARELLAPAFQRLDPTLSFEYADDVLSLVLHQVLDHARALGLARANIGLVQDESTLAGPYEFPTIAEHYRRQGYHAQVVDPRALVVRNGELFAGDTPLDVLYRDPTLENLLEMERKGDDLTAMRFAFEKNRVVSGLVGELDHKGALEVLTSERMARHLTDEQRETFRRHLPWTRVVRPTRTKDPDGRDVDLATYTRSHRERLVLKPNRDYGGAGVTLGRETAAPEWEQRLEEALHRPFETVVQEAVEVYVERYPVLAGDRVSFEPFFNIAGFSGTRRGMATLARMARGRIVNITRDGGVAGVLATR